MLFDVRLSAGLQGARHNLNLILVLCYKRMLYKWDIKQGACRIGIGGSKLDSVTNYRKLFLVACSVEGKWLQLKISDRIRYRQRVM
jgi:hypothetical protein